ncbi:hypothetical protein BT69DRAFT_1296724 [Atractiella rhizophila]|nr:hypothetical protein BT69DRAFT_1296724 [Atractiella rhizophila]
MDSRDRAAATEGTDVWIRRQILTSSFSELQDRRPISPPVMVKLHAWNADDEEVPCDDIEATFFVLNADIWAENLSTDLNMVIHPHGMSTSPNVSHLLNPASGNGGGSWNGSGGSPYENGAGESSATDFALHQHQAHPQAQGGYGPLPPHYSSTPPTNPLLEAINSELDNENPQGEGPSSSRQPLQPQQQGQGLVLPSTQGDAPEATANVVGHLQASNHKLYDLEGKSGIWFIFHDLSVRTEGTYRLRLMLFNIGVQGENGWTTSNGMTRAVCTCHTQPFTVYTAKKFPGMVDPTPLSKHFAKQGVRIPTRRGAKRKDEGEEANEGD